MDMHRDSVAYININHLMDNVDYIYKKTNKKIMAMVKANAYGHGLIELSKILDKLESIEMFGVATFEEALELRKANIEKDILVLGVTKINDIDLVIENNIRITIYSMKFLNELNELKLSNKVYCHLKLDTGMNRIGIKEKETILTSLELLSKNPNIVIEGIFTHYGAADEENDTYLKQFKLFKDITKNLKVKYLHAANSAASLYHQEDYTNIIRCGIALYGIEANGSTLSTPLKQVMSLYSKVSMVKKINKGEKVGYGFTYQADEDAYIATISLGYGDGFVRKNQGRDVYINGKYYPIVGRVCMDQLMIKVDEFVKEADDVEIFGEHISLNQMAKELDTIAYEIICLISRRIPRIYINYDK